MDATCVTMTDIPRKRPELPADQVSHPLICIVANCVHANRALGRVNTDGTNDSDCLPPFHPLNKPLPELHEPTLPLYHVNRDTSTETGAIPLSDLPDKPPATFHYGGDGHYSIDHPNERPRAQHLPGSNSTRSRSQRKSESQYEENPEQSYRSGPSIETGDSDSSSRSGF
jgi:aquaporin related protein